MKNSERPTFLFRYRLALGFFIFGLVTSGLTAFPLEMESALLNRWLGLNPPIDPNGSLFQLHAFISRVHYGVQLTYQQFPFFGYGTDWLGFGHFVIAAFFVLPFVDPIRYRAIVQIGLFACGGVIVFALIAGPIRHIPIYWTMIDCSFGIAGAIPLLYCLRLTRRPGN